MYLDYNDALQIYKFIEPNQNLDQKVRVRHIDGFGSVRFEFFKGCL